MQVISGHLGWVRSVMFSPNNQWFCTGSADRTIKVIRSYYGHLSGVYCLALHPTIDVFTGGSDSVWDIRSKKQIHALSGHDNTVCSVFTRPTVSNTTLQLNSTSISSFFNR
ncbi:putative transcription factor WD40-like family [Helianthus anomalus]